MTSPITAEERAKALIDAEDEFIKANGMFVGGGTLHRLETSIASAIREAEDAALERAAEHFNKQAPSVAALVDGIGPLGEKLVGLFETSIPDDIRSLKSTKETGHE